MPSGTLTVGQNRTLKEIVRYVCERQLQAGDRLLETVLAEVTGTSRTPVRVVLDYLVNEGVATYEKSKGYILAVDAGSIPETVLDRLRQPEDPLYVQLAEARLNGEVAGSVTESDLMRKFGATRSAIRRVVTLAQREGWAVKEAGYGVRFLPIIDNQDAYDDMYRLRLALEPAGILSPRFRPNMVQLRALREEQEAILKGGHNVISASDRFESNARFHETIMSWSHNQLALQILRNLYQMRRLAEYRQEKQAQPRQVHVTHDHLQILDAIERGDTISAASLLRQHISEAIENKVATVKLTNSPQALAVAPAKVVEGAEGKPGSSKRRRKACQ
ncbi:GntR family transcriptional regulator [Noviherbaspirillum aerium]|uniref:GntR family transcriptional regulator n=1 Tax=Noviherbaspirillum aerium TaxID=2588497 RepID=UPI00124D195A|nr:GntR family transcriptional regulator [Noviherbaspirillum aerium]